MVYMCLGCAVRFFLRCLESLKYNPVFLFRVWHMRMILASTAAANIVCIRGMISSLLFFVFCIFVYFLSWQVLNQTSRLEIQLLENSLSTNKLEKELMVQTNEISKLHDKNR